MQHPDEGMIHSWLDGALSAEEAAGVESHVSGCASCAATVAEARGFIAASSRILTALDNVPRGVLPAVPAKRRDFRIAWRAAAAMLIVAGGSLVVMREGGQDARVASREKSATSVASPTSMVLPTAAPSADAAEDGMKASAANTAAAPTPTRTTPPVVPQPREESPPPTDMSTRSDLGRGTQSSGGVSGTTAVTAESIAPTARRMAMSQAAPGSDASALKVVRIDRSFGSRRTVYEIAPSATVTLTEIDPTPLSAIVATGSGAAAASGTEERNANRAQRTAQPMRAEAAKAPPPPPPSVLMDSRSAADSESRAVAGTMSKTSVEGQAGAALSSPTNTIRWTEPKTGKTLTLSGNVSVERLQEIRKRIETERASSGEKLP
jgi:hypothetical protein